MKQDEISDWPFDNAWWSLQNVHSDQTVSARVNFYRILRRGHFPSGSLFTSTKSSFWSERDADVHFERTCREMKYSLDHRRQKCWAICVTSSHHLLLSGILDVDDSGSGTRKEQDLITKWAGVKGNNSETSSDRGTKGRESRRLQSCKDVWSTPPLRWRRWRLAAKVRGLNVDFVDIGRKPY